MMIRVSLVLTCVLFLFHSTLFALQADFNGDNVTNFTDFLILSGNFEKTAAEFPDNSVDHEDGDADGDGDIDFADFLILSGEFGQEVEQVSSQSQLESINSNGFQSNKEYILMTSSFAQLTEDLLVENVSNTVLCFGNDFGGNEVKFTNTLTLKDCTDVQVVNLNAEASAIFSPDEYIAGPISGQPACIETARQIANQMVPFGDDFGVVNIINCQDVTLSESFVKNTRIYSGTTFRTQSSCAVNIGDSTEVILDDCSFEGDGKSVVLVHNCPDSLNEKPGVKVTNCTVSGRYFEFNLGASDVTVEDTMVFQDFGSPVDSHSAVTVTPAYGTQPLKLKCAEPESHEYEVAEWGLANGKLATHSPKVDFTRVTFVMETGRPVVSGNSSDFSKVCTVTLTDARLKITSAHRGLLRWHGGASNSIKLKVSGTTKMWNANGAFSPVNDYRIVETNDWVDYLTTTHNNVQAPSGIAALGRFVNYDNPPVIYLPGRTAESAEFSAYSVTNPLFKQ